MVGIHTSPVVSQIAPITEMPRIERDGLQSRHAVEEAKGKLVNAAAQSSSLAEVAENVRKTLQASGLNPDHLGISDHSYYRAGQKETLTFTSTASEKTKNPLETVSNVDEAVETTSITKKKSVILAKLEQSSQLGTDIDLTLNPLARPDIQKSSPERVRGNSGFLEKRGGVLNLTEVSDSLGISVRESLNRLLNARENVSRTPIVVDARPTPNSANENRVIALNNITPFDRATLSKHGPAISLVKDPVAEGQQELIPA
jgi:hypothetical protein